MNLISDRGIPNDELDIEQYLEHRLKNQRRYYVDAAAKQVRKRDSRRNLIALTTASAGVLSTADSMLTLSSTLNKDAVLWTAHHVLVAAAAFIGSVTLVLVADLAASRAEYFATSYRSAARQLRVLRQDWIAKKYTGDDAAQQFVLEVEQVLAKERGSFGSNAVALTADRIGAVAAPPAAPPPAAAAPAAAAPGEDDDEQVPFERAGRATAADEESE